MIYDYRTWVTAWWLSFTAFWFWFMAWAAFWGIGQLIGLIKKSLRHKL